MFHFALIYMFLTTVAAANNADILIKKPYLVKHCNNSVMRWTKFMVVVDFTVPFSTRLLVETVRHLPAIFCKKSFAVTPEIQASQTVHHLPATFCKKTSTVTQEIQA